MQDTSREARSGLLAAALTECRVIREMTSVAVADLAFNRHCKQAVAYSFAAVARDSACAQLPHSQNALRRCGGTGEPTRHTKRVRSFRHSTGVIIAPHRGQMP